jgi:hypothetical protein
MNALIKLCGRGIKIQGSLVRIARIDGEKFLFLDAPGPIIDGLHNCGVRVDLFTFMPRLPATSPNHPYPMEMDNLAVLPISTFDHWWTKQIGFKARNKAKQAEKRGIVVREVPFDEILVRGIWEVYNECPVRQGIPFQHYGMNIEEVRKHAATFLDRSIFVGAFADEKLIGFIKLTVDETRTQAGLMHIVSMVGHKDKAPTNALIAQAVRSCAEREIPYLVYSNFAYIKKEQSSLSEFKERNGFQRVDLPRYYVPLSSVGRIALRFGLHRPFVDRLPEPMVARLREFRKAWYNRKFQPATEGY